jgi:exonuclease SbcD
MRILHTADWHLGDRLGRIDRTGDLRRAVERIAHYCETEKADVLLIAGDLFSELSRPDSLREAVEHLKDVFLPFLHQGGTIVALTGNHDNENFCQTLHSAMALAAPASGRLGEVLPAGRFYLAAEPAVLRLAAPGGQTVQFVLMPYPTPSRYLDPQAQRYRSVEERNQALSAAFRTRLWYAPEHPDFDPQMPTVLAAHIHVQGARMPGLFRMSDRQTVLLADEDLPARYAYVALGHVHQPQSLRGLAHVRYCGSIERLDLGERYDEKGVVLVDIGPEGRPAEPVCLPLEATPIYDVEINNPREEIPRLRERYPDAERALVRYRVRYTAGTDNLEEILRELNTVFPRWYDREWREAGADGLAPLGFAPPGGPRSFHDTVVEYLQVELEDHPEQAALLQLANELLAEKE